jgi:hypothetical protein
MIRHVPSSKPDNLFAVELWAVDGNARLEVLATAGVYHLANAAFEEAVRRYPGQRLMMRHGIRVVLDSRP